MENYLFRKSEERFNSDDSRSSWLTFGTADSRPAKGCEFVSLLFDKISPGHSKAKRKTKILFDFFQPEIDVSVMVNDSLLTEEQMQETNLMNFTVESLYSPPEAWTLQTASQYTFTAATPLPISAEVSETCKIEICVDNCLVRNTTHKGDVTRVLLFCLQKDNCVVFAGGQLKVSADKDAQARERKWALPGVAQGNAANINDKYDSLLYTRSRVSGNSSTRMHAV